MHIFTYKQITHVSGFNTVRKFNSHTFQRSDLQVSNITIYFESSISNRSIIPMSEYPSRSYANVLANASIIAGAASSLFDIMSKAAEQSESNKQSTPVLESSNSTSSPNLLPFQAVPNTTPSTIPPATHSFQPPNPSVPPQSDRSISATQYSASVAVHLPNHQPSTTASPEARASSTRSSQSSGVALNPSSNPIMASSESAFRPMTTTAPLPGSTPPLLPKEHPIPTNSPFSMGSRRIPRSNFIPTNRPIPKSSQLSNSPPLLKASTVHTTALLPNVPSSPNVGSTPAQINVQTTAGSSAANPIAVTEDATDSRYKPVSRKRDLNGQRKRRRDMRSGFMQKEVDLEDASRAMGWDKPPKEKVRVLRLPERKVN